MALTNEKERALSRAGRPALLRPARDKDLESGFSLP